MAGTPEAHDVTIASSSSRENAPLASSPTRLGRVRQSSTASTGGHHASTKST